MTIGPLAPTISGAALVGDTDETLAELRGTRVVFRLYIGILGTVCLLAAVVAAIKAPILWVPAGLNIAVTIAVALWLRTTRLVLADGAITYRSFLVQRAYWSRTSTTPAS